jgi:hypothetical protein
VIPETRYTYHGALPTGTRVTPLRTVADDGAETWALLHEPPGPPVRVVVALAHPRVAFSRHYLIPGLLEAGLAVLGHDLRTLHNDTGARHERLLLDVAAGLRLVRDRFARLVLLGNSGGGPLLAAHQAAGHPRADGLIVLAAHPGEGRFLLQTIDPSVIDEDDPLSCDPTLDMFAPDNGYDPASRTARYAPAFLARYREAQRARVARLDDRARAQIALERAARAAGDPRRAIPHRLLVVYRTVANPAYLDLSIDPNDRDVGTIFGGRPELGNFYEQGIARVVSPRTWLSIWSGLTAPPRFLEAAPALDVPVLFLPAAGDSDILPADAEAMWSALGAVDRTRHDLAGADHYLRPTRRGRGGDPRAEALEVVTEWIRRRF